MKEYKVLIEFIDKETNERREVGSVISVTDNRAKEINENVKSSIGEYPTLEELEKKTKKVNKKEVKEDDK